MIIQIAEVSKDLVLKFESFDQKLQEMNFEIIESNLYCDDGGFNYYDCKINTNFDFNLFFRVHIRDYAFEENKWIVSISNHFKDPEMAKQMLRSYNSPMLNWPLKDIMQGPSSSWPNMNRNDNMFVKFKNFVVFLKGFEYGRRSS